MHLGNCKNCGRVGPSGVECRKCIGQDPPKHHIGFLCESQGNRASQPVQPIALANALGVWKEDDLKMWTAFKLEEKFFEEVNPDWHVPEPDKKTGGLNKTKILGAEDEESKSEDDAHEASLVLAKRLNVDWDNVKESKKRCVNWHAHTLLPKEVKNWQRKVLEN